MVCWRCAKINLASPTRPTGDYSLGTKADVWKRYSTCKFCEMCWDASQNFEMQNDDSEIKVNWSKYGFYPGGGASATRIVYLDESTAKSPYASGRVVQPETSPHLMKKWLRICETGHPECKPIPLSFRPPAPPTRAGPGLQFLRVIDVIEMCLIKAPKKARYLALSYVWGNAKKVLLTSDNKDDFQKKGGLKPILPTLARSIRDAFHLVTLLGERYLWVDALCLQDDDEDDKKHGMRNMDAIYEGALLTIIAANGKDANSGLSGINNQARLTQYIQEVLPGVKLTVVEGVYDILGDSEDTAYMERGWTLQELVLSHRCLIFVKSQVYFRCRCTMFSEDTIWDNYPKIRSPLATIASKNETPFLYKNEPNPATSYWLFSWYYSARMLKHDSDAVWALSGILKRLETTMNSSRLCGLLTSQFDICLLFWRQQATATSKFVRRGNFPSWSWAGWKGVTVGFEPSKKQEKIWLQTMTEDIIFYKRDPKSGKLQRVWGPADQAGLTKNNPGFGRILPKETAKHAPTNIPSSSIRDVPQYFILQFWAPTLPNARVRFQEGGVGVILTPGGVPVGGILADDPDLVNDRNDYDYVLLSKADEAKNFISGVLRKPVSSASDAERLMEYKLKVEANRPLYWVLLVDWEAYDICAERRAIGFIYQDRLKDFGTSKWKEIILA